MDDILSYLNSKNIEYTIDGQEAKLTCPNCGKREKLYMNINSGVFHCFVCEVESPDSLFARGHISQLKEEWGDVIPISTVMPQKNQKESDCSTQVDEYYNKIMDGSSLSKRAQRYLLNRGINKDSIDRFKLGVMNRHGQDWISMPSFENGIPKLIKYRKLPPYNDNCVIQDKCFREKDCKSILFNGDALKDHDDIIICEGEMDAITLVQNGYENVIGVTGGCGTLLTPWYDKLIMKNRLYLCFDTDDDGQGQEAAKNVWATRLGFTKCYNILLPKGHDINSFFGEHTSEEFDELYVNSERFKVSGIISLDEALNEMYARSHDETTNNNKLPLPWAEVNKLLGGGLARQRLTVLGAKPGVGKTSMAIQILYHFAVEYKMPGLMFCLEMPEVSLAVKIIQLHYDLRIEEVDYSDALIYSMEIGDIPIYFGYSSKVTPELFYNTMVEVRNRYGVEIGVFDNLQRMIRSGKESDMAQASGMFKDITMDLNIPFILISQPKKLQEDKSVLDYDDLKGTSAIPADADEVILLHRKRVKGKVGNDALKSETQVIVDKSRFASGGRRMLHFEGAKSKFLDERNDDE